MVGLCIPVGDPKDEVGIKDSLSESAIVRAVAGEVGRRVTRKVTPICNR